MYRIFSGFVAGLVVWTSGLVAFSPVALADLSKASDWVGRAVLTQDGKPLGRIEDIALDIQRGEVQYLVVSIGSYLIEDSLIAVQPDALSPAPQGSALVVQADNLASARRFNADTWPERADVTRAADAATRPPPAASTAAADTDAPAAERGFNRSGSATISDGRRRGTVTAGASHIEAIAGTSTAGNQAATVDPAALPLPTFKSLDRDGDGALSRREIGARLGRLESFPEIDLDDSGAVDRFEFEALQLARGR